MVPAGSLAGSLAGTRMHVLYTTLHVSRFLSDGRIYAFGEEALRFWSKKGYPQIQALHFWVCRSAKRQ